MEGETEALQAPSLRAKKRALESWFHDPDTLDGAFIFGHEDTKACSAKAGRAGGVVHFTSWLCSQPGKCS